MMKFLATKSKQICALLLVFVMAFGLSVSVPDNVQAQGKYWIKVNKKANVATVYQLKSGKYKPIKAFLVSCGGSNTPSGTFYTPAKYRWHTLMGPSYGQYCTRIHGGILFHSVWYYSHSKASQSTKEFNKLGQTASHGCVRLSVADAKWIYDHCALGTKVTVYSSSNPGPLGKPKGLKVSTARKMYWDPTDPDKNNPYNKLKPSISISKKKAKTVQYGAKYSIRSGVSAKQKNRVSLTSKIKYSVKKYSRAKKKYLKTSFSTKKLGTYKITYRVTSRGGTTVYKDFKLKVVDTKAPVITASNRNVRINSTNAVSGVRARQVSGAYRTSAMYLYIKAPGAKSYTKYTYSKAKSYRFTKAGTYYVQYRVKGKYSPYRLAKKSVRIYCWKDAVMNTSTAEVRMVNTAAEDELIQAVRNVVSVNDNGTIIKGTDSKIRVTLVKDAAGNVTSAKISYKGRSGYTVYKTVKITLTEPVTEQPTTEQESTEATTEVQP